MTNGFPVVWPRVTTRVAGAAPLGFGNWSFLPAPPRLRAYLRPADRQAATHSQVGR
jgi:hypothetical protein